MASCTEIGIVTLLSVMLFSMPNLITSGCSHSPGGGEQSSKYEVYYQWKQIDYNFPNESYREKLIQSEKFIQLNCIPNAMKIYKDKLFITTSRYLKGVPSTLNVIPYENERVPKTLKYRNNTGPKLTPFPSWEMQEVGNCSAFQLVQQMEVDPYNRLWILDVGRIDLLTQTPSSPCPAKLVIMDLENGNKIERIHEFPDEVAPRNSNAIKDMQIACKSRDDCVTYISNINMTCSLVIYDLKSNSSWYATHPLMQPDLTRASITINGVTALAPFGITGLGLTPKSTGHSHLYFSKIAGDHIYRIPTAVLKNEELLKENPNLEIGAIQDLGIKPMGQADGGAMDQRGIWYFGSLPESAIYNIDTNLVKESNLIISKYEKVVGNDVDMQWPDTFSFDGKGNLLVITNRFHLYSQPTGNQIDPQDTNYRVIRFKTNSVSYQS